MEVILAEFQASNKTLQERNTQLEKQVTRLDTQVSALRHDKDKLQTERDKLQEYLVALRQDVAALRKEKSMLRERDALLVKQNDTLSCALRDSQAQTTTLIHYMGRASGTLDRMRPCLQQVGALLDPKRPRLPAPSFYASAITTIKPGITTVQCVVDRSRGVLDVTRRIYQNMSSDNERFEVADSTPVGQHHDLISMSAVHSMLQERSEMANESRKRKVRDQLVMEYDCGDENENRKEIFVSFRKRLKRCRSMKSRKSCDRFSPTPRATK